ncbi:hypothetical protein Tco_0318613 [Tanacetum coccineum]
MHATKEEKRCCMDPGIPEGPVTQSVITQNDAYQADDLDAYDSDYDDITTTKVALMANLSHYGSDVLSKVQNSDNTHNEMINQSVNEMQYSEPSHLVVYPKNEITCDSNIIPYSQYLLESQNATVNEEHLNANKSVSAKLERYKERVKLLEERQNIDLKIALEKKVKELDNIVYKMGQSAQTVHMLTKPQFFFDNTTNQALGFQNPFYLKKAQQINLMLYDGSVIAKGNCVMSIADSEETLILKEESRSKMLLKQNDPEMAEKKVNTKPVDYKRLNQLSEDFGKRFVPQSELSAEQVFWSKISSSPVDPSTCSTHVKSVVPRELPKVSMVNSILKKLKFHLAGFDSVVKQRTTPTAITEGS